MTALSEHLDRYVALRRALGYRPDNDARLLGDFVRYLDASDQSSLTVEAALGWAALAPTDKASAAHLTTVRGFARYLAGFDHNTQVPPAGLIRVSDVRPTPYIYSPREVAALMTAAMGLTPELWAATMATLVGLLAATGIRPGEAYRLRREHVDFEDAQLSVVHSKHGKSRRIPLDPSTIEALDRYARLRDRAFEDQAGKGFFLTGDGAGLTSHVVAPTFRRLLQLASIEAPYGRRRPRLGDLRHTFAVSTLLAWHERGVDVQRQLPVLSAYLGHNEPRVTYWYLEATPELMALAARRLQLSWEQRS
ncbi:MAG TPA: tyrosine-type recombinase/integrase [Acidimicrobiales bacterium]|nr:tyrosine-type recombinase/integrase [Acidimicrobiales bacterium]